MLGVTGMTFVRNAFEGGFPFESLIPVMSITDSIIVCDMGSTDGSLELLKEIEQNNPKFKVIQKQWSTTTNPSAFKDISNYLLDICPTKAAYEWQMDEILPERLTREIREQYLLGNYNMTFERIQLSHGGHVVKWLPHVVMRSMETSGRYRFDKDGYSVADSGGSLHMCRNPITGEAHKGRQMPWHQPAPGKEFDPKNPTVLNEIMAKVFPWDQFLVDTSSMFRDNQQGKKNLHRSFWNESSSLGGLNLNDPLWSNTNQTFPMPSVARGLVGMTRYKLRPEVKKSLMTGSFYEWGL